MPMRISASTGSSSCSCRTPARSARTPSPVDKNPLDLEQAFATTRARSAAARSFRVGRQEMAFDLQRFIATRDGPNVRQAFDAVLGRLSTRSGASSAMRRSRCRTATRPISTTCRIAISRSAACASSGVGRAGRPVRLLVALQPQQRAVPRRERSRASRRVGRAPRARWGASTGTSKRCCRPARSATRRSGRAVGSIAGYKLDSPWSPRIALQVDAAPGDRHPHDGRVSTFNPLFPNGYYFTLAGYTSYANLIHVKPSVTLKPSANLSLLGARLPVARDDRRRRSSAAEHPGAGHGGRADCGPGCTCSCARLDDCREPIGAIEAVHFQVGDAIRQAAGADYVGVELKYVVARAPRACAGSAADAWCRMNARVQVLAYSDEMLIVRWLAPGGAEQRWAARALRSGRCALSGEKIVCGDAVFSPRGGRHSNRKR